MESMQPANLIILILLIAFAIDRIVNGCLFLLSFNPRYAARFADPQSLPAGGERAAAEKRYQLVYFVLAAALSIVVIAGFGQIRVLRGLGVIPPAAAEAKPQGGEAAAPAQPAGQGENKTEGQASSPGWWHRLSFMEVLDVLLTGLMLAGAAERLSPLLRAYGVPGKEKEEARPIEVRGSLRLEEDSRRPEPPV
jgi:hypothetical protein